MIADSPADDSRSLSIAKKLEATSVLRTENSPSRPAFDPYV